MGSDYILPPRTPREMAEVPTTDWDKVHKKVTRDMLFEKLREYIKSLPLHQQIKLTGQIMKGDYYIEKK